MIEMLSAAEMAACDLYTIEEIGVPSAVLMERAAYCCAKEAEALFEGEMARRRKVLAVCGTGNNGGDGYACARILYLAGWEVMLLSAGDPGKRTCETKRQYEICRKLGIPETDEPEHVSMEEYDLIIDALFGIGLKRAVTGSYAALIRRINEAGCRVLSVDIPSGIHADTGQEMGCGVHADVTVTMEAYKPGLFLGAGRSFSGRVVRSEIGVICSADPGKGTRQAEPLARAFTKEDLDLLPRRKPDGNKGDFGKVLVVAGSSKMAGAAYFAAAGALAAGAGMVRIVTHRANREILLTLLPEALADTYEREEELVPLLGSCLPWADIVICGPGMGASPSTRLAVSFLLGHARVPMILDADALNVLAPDPEPLKHAASPLCLTPHVGEMSRLSGIPAAELKADPLKAAADFAKAFGVTLVLKDAGTVTAGADGSLYINTSGNDGMATAGSGDVLTGILAACCASGADPALAYPLGVFLHGLAGDLAKERIGAYGMKAGDLIEAAAEVLRSFSSLREGGL